MTKALSILAGFVIFGGFAACASASTDPVLGSSGGNTPPKKIDAGGSAFTPAPSPESSSSSSSGSGSDDGSIVAAGDDAATEAAVGDDSATGDGSFIPSDALASCGPSTCGGCCDAMGRCLGGADVAACGTGGGTCQGCGPLLTCQTGVCGGSSSGGNPDAGGDMCANLGCIDFFDCAIFHAAQLGPCGFTKCDGLICKK